MINELDTGFFLFIDPPYFNARQDGFYTASFKKEDHLRLARILKKKINKFKFLLTYDNSPEIRELYAWCSLVLEKEWNYTLFRTDDQKNEKKLKDGHIGKRYKGQELFIMNYSSEDMIGQKEFKFDI